MFVVVIGSRRRGHRRRLYMISRYPCAHPLRASVFKVTGAQALRDATVAYARLRAHSLMPALVWLSLRWFSSPLTCQTQGMDIGYQSPDNQAQ